MDKLSEVKAVEQEEGREVEERDRERDDRKRQIHALKHPEEASLYRKTLRHARQLYEGIRVDRHEKKDWQKPFSAPSHTHLRRALSTTASASVSTHTNTREQATPKRILKQANPLRFVMNPLSRVTAGREESVREGLKSDRQSSQSSKHVVASGTWEGVGPSKKIRRRRSTASSPEAPISHTEPDLPHTVSYERTQSLPVDASPTSRVPEGTAEESAAAAVRLETISEDTLTTSAGEERTKTQETVTEAEDETEHTRYI